jgi:hypothetical protein
MGDPPDETTHYGWIQFRTTYDNVQSTSQILGWAYETEPDKPIHIEDCQAIPTLNEWGVLILAGLILAEGGRRLRKKSIEC